MIPLMTVSLADVPNEQMGNASGVNNLARSIGGSIGISLTTALVVRGTQAHSALLVGHLSPYRPEFQQYLQSATDMLGQYSDPATAQGQAYGLLYGTVQQQANLFAYVDTFRLLAFLCVLCVPVVFLLKKAKPAVVPSPSIEFMEKAAASLYCPSMEVFLFLRKASSLGVTAGQAGSGPHRIMRCPLPGTIH